MYGADKKRISPEGQGPKDKTRKKLRCGTFNVRSLLNKTVGLLEHLWEADCDICFMQETFLRDGDKAKLTEIKDSGWSILSDPRKHRSGGGIAMVYRSSIELKPNTKVTKFKSFQVMESLLSAESELLRLVNIYRPPYTKKARYTECDFLKEFEEYLKILCVKPGNPLLTGDFNFHVERPNEHYPKKFLDLLDLYNLRQHVPIVPTHDQGGTLDLVITTQSLENKISNFGIVQSRTSSDHFLVLFDVDTRLSKNDNGKFLSYRNFSCETLLVRMTDDINKDIQAGNIVAVVLLDLSAAFDTIDHEILLEKLFKHYGVTGKALQWLRSYLESRYFCVKIGDTISSLLELLFGVPQGSLLGPILFILYIKDLQNIAAKFGLDIQLYADDSQLYISFHPSFPSELADVKDRINRCLSEIKHWTVGNFMKLNESKTELLVLGKSKVLKDCKMEVTVHFGNSTVTPTECKGDSWKSLGVKFDKSLTMERQINSVKQKCSWTMMNLRTIGRYLDVEVKLMMVTQLVISKLDYCNSLYMNLPKTRLNKLRSTLNGAIRFIYNIKDRSEDLLPYYMSTREHISFLLANEFSLKSAS